MIANQALRIPKSKDLMCGYLLVKIFDHWLNRHGYSTNNDNDLAHNARIVKSFITETIQDNAFSWNELGQFGINNVEKLQKTLLQAFRNLANNGFEF